MATSNNSGGDTAAAAAAAAAMSAHDMDLCRQTINLLLSQKYKDKNILFRDPFDLSQVPGYLDVCQRQLDISTVSKNLESGMYHTKDDFFADAMLIFENARKYHTGRPQTQWIVKPAKEMLKVVEKVKRNSEKKKNHPASTSSTSMPPSSLSLSLSLSSSSTKSHDMTMMMHKKALPIMKREGSNVVKKVPSLKLKFNASAASVTAVPKDNATKATAATPTPTTATATASRDDSKQQAVSEGGKPTVVKAMPTQPKIKLKLSLSQKSTSSSSSQKSSSSSQPALPMAAAAAAAAAARVETPKPPPTSTSTTTAASANSATPQPQQLPATTTTTTTKTTTQPVVVASSKPEPIKIQVKPPVSRGKELPKGVTPPQKTPKATSKSKSANKGGGGGGRKPSITPTTSATTAATTITSSTNTADSMSSGMTSTRKEQCMKVILGLKRRKYKQVNWFLQPVALKQMDDYRSKIKFPSDLATMTSKLDKNQYASIADFVLDMRRIFANCLRFNTSVKESLRPVAADVLSTAEDLMAWFLVKPEIHNNNNNNTTAMPFPPLLYCWKLCVNILNNICDLTNPNDNLPTSFYFLHPVSVYCGGNFPPDYFEKVPRPMDFGTITSKLIEGQYQTVDAFAADCRLVIGNCMSYYGGRADGRDIIEQANRLNSLLSQQLDELTRYDQSDKGVAAAAANAASKASATLNYSYYETVKLEKPPESLLMNIITEMRALQYTDKATQITEPALQTFENPEPLSLYPDYLQVIANPIDVPTIERKARSGFYETPEDFESDMLLMFRNCEIYHGFKKNEHRIALGKFASKQFRRLFAIRMRAWEDPGQAHTGAATAATTTPNEGSRKDLKRTASPAVSQTSQSVKKLKMEGSSGGGASKGKSAPRISITAAQNSGLTAADKSNSAQNASRVKSPKVISSSSSSSSAAATTASAAAAAAAAAAVAASSVVSTTKKKSPDLPKPNQPVPLHVAIARVKEGFPLRRPLKDLQDWEKTCARFLKELLRHAWFAQTAKPRLEFTVPVGDLFPELRDAYSAKIKKPMDLTTVECILMHGSRYSGADDFVSDVALVFVNAITFNKDGHDLGDPLSCAYYDASIHLLRYTRWLSLELLSEYLDESDHVDDMRPDGLPPFSWRLTNGNRKKAREETESIVLCEPIEKSIEGDRYTWMESECEKLLKALRHQSDLRYMTFFIQPNYPPDYAAFISKPMDWERCQKTLKKRQYDKFGDIIADLRLIFSNALKYNARLKGTDSISGKAYEAAKYMSCKLETAIDKMMISVSDRLERERINQANAEREFEAKRDQQRKTQSEKEGSNPSSVEPFPTERAGFGSRRVAPRKVSNFEMSFFEDENEGTHEQSHIDSLKQQKSLFEKQHQELQKMNNIARIAGGAVFAQLVGKTNALKWVDESTAKYKSLCQTEPGGAGGARSTTTTTTTTTTTSGTIGTSTLQGGADSINVGGKERAPVKMTMLTLAGARRKYRKKFVNNSLS